MSISHSRGSYQDCYDVMDKALEDSHGMRVRMSNIDSATHFRMRINQARAIDRRDNKEIYEGGHHLYGRSIYDPLVARIRQGWVLGNGDDEPEFQVWVYLEQCKIELMEVEALSVAEILPLEPYRPVPALAARIVQVPIQLQIEQPKAPALTYQPLIRRL